MARELQFVGDMTPHRAYPYILLTLGLVGPAAGCLSASGNTNDQDDKDKSSQVNVIWAGNSHTLWLDEDDDGNPLEVVNIPRRLRDQSLASGRDLRVGNTDDADPANDYDQVVTWLGHTLDDIFPYAKSRLQRCGAETDVLILQNSSWRQAFEPAALISDVTEYLDALDGYGCKPWRVVLVGAVPPQNGVLLEDGQSTKSCAQMQVDMETNLNATRTDVAAAYPRLSIAAVPMTNFCTPSMYGALDPDHAAPAAQDQIAAAILGAIY